MSNALTMPHVRLGADEVRMYPMAAPLITQSWLNAADDFSLAALRGRVVLVEVLWRWAQ